MTDMQKANPIRRRFLGHWAIPLDGSPPRPNDGWVADCPECGEQVRWRDGHMFNARATRKNTKDALYRHVQQEHGPGSVGRA